MPPLKLLAISFALISSQLGAQSRKADSLAKLLQKSKGIEKVNTLNQLAFEYLSKDNTKAMEYCDQAISLGNDIGYQKGVGQAYTYRGVYEYLSGEYSDGRGNLRKGLNLAIKTGDKRNQGYTIMQLGNSYVNQGQMDSALIFYKKSYEILRDSTDPTVLSKLYRNMSILFGLRSEFDLEKLYLIRSMKIREKMGDITLITDALILLASMNIKEGNLALADQNLDSAKQLLAENPEDQENLNDWRHQKALILLHENKYQEALVLFDSAISYYSRKSLLKNYVVLQSDLGKIFNDRGEYEIAIKCFEDALQVAETKGYDVEIADINLQIGWTTFNQGDRNQSLKLANQTLLWAEKNNVISRKGDALLLKGIVLTKLMEFEQAKTCFEQALSAREQMKDKAKISEAYENLGYLELKRGNYGRSLDYYNKSLSLAYLAKYPLGVVWSLYGLGRVSKNLGQYGDALNYFDLGEKKAIAISAREALTDIYREKTELFKVQKKFEQSLRYSQLSFALYDSLHRSAIGQKFGSLQRYQEIKQKEREIKSLAQEKELAQEKILLQEQRLNQQYYLILSGATLLILFGALAFVYARFYFRVKRLNLEINQQKRELQTQANYINELNKDLESKVTEKTIELQKTNKELIKQNDELLQFSYSVSHNLRGPVARMLGLTNIFRQSNDITEQNLMIDYVHRASHDLDNILRDLSKIIDVRNELHNIKEWVDLEEEWLRCCSLLSDVIKVDFQISHDFEIVPKMFTVKAFVQSVFYNLLSNSIKYRSDKRALTVHASSRAEGVNGYIEVADNGLGIDVDKFKDSLFKLFKRFHTHVEGRGLGLHLIKSQIESLNGTLHVESIVNQGTIFRVMIPQVLRDQAIINSPANSTLYQ